MPLFSRKPKEPKFKRCGRCHMDREDVSVDPEWTMLLCSDCWSRMPRAQRNRTMPRDRPAPKPD